MFCDDIIMIMWNDMDMSIENVFPSIHSVTTATGGPYLPIKREISRLRRRLELILEGLIFDLDFVVVLFCCVLFTFLRNWESLISGKLGYCTYISTLKGLISSD